MDSGTDSEDDNVIKSGVLYTRLGENFGQLFTDFVREIAWDDCDRAEAVLKVQRGLRGITVNQAEEVVDGKKKFVTMDDGIHVDMVDDNWAPPDFDDYRKKAQEVVDFVYESERQSLKMFGGGWFAYLSEHERSILMISATHVKDMIRKEPVKALCMAKELKIIVLDYQKRVSEVFQDRVESGRAHRGEQRGESGGGDILDRIAEDSLRNIATSDLPEEEKRRLMRVTKGIIGGHKGDIKVEEDPGFKYDTGWLTREGMYYGCEPGQHIPLAHGLVEELFPDTEGDMEQILEGKGWMKCTGKEWHTTKKPPTIKQKKAIVNWSDIHGQRVKWNGKETTIRELQEEGFL